MKYTQLLPLMYRNLHLPELSFDDQLWHRSISTNKWLYETKRESLNGIAERHLYDELWHGTRDFTEMDRPWDASTRAIRYSASVVTRLWDVVQEERTARHRLEASVELLTAQVSNLGDGFALQERVIEDHHMEHGRLTRKIEEQNLRASRHRDEIETARGEMQDIQRRLTEMGETIVEHQAKVGVERWLAI